MKTLNPMTLALIAAPILIFQTGAVLAEGRVKTAEGIRSPAKNEGPCHFGVAQVRPNSPTRLSKRRITRSQIFERFGIQLTPENSAQWLDQELLQVKVRAIEERQVERFLKRYTDRDPSDYAGFSGCLIQSVQVDESRVILPHFRLENAARHLAIPFIALTETIAVIGSLGVYPGLYWWATGPFPVTVQWFDETTDHQNLRVPFFLTQDPRECSEDFIIDQKVLRPYVSCG